MNQSLKSWRDSLGLNVSEAAVKAGVTPAMWSRWENNKRRVPVERLVGLETLTGVPREELRPDLAGLLNGEGRAA